MQILSFIEGGYLTAFVFLEVSQGGEPEHGDRQIFKFCQLGQSKSFSRVQFNYQNETR